MLDFTDRTFGEFFEEHTRRDIDTLFLDKALEHEKALGLTGRITASLLRTDLVILDELGYLPFSQAGVQKCKKPAGLRSRAGQRPGVGLAETTTLDVRTQGSAPNQSRELRHWCTRYQS